MRSELKNSCCYRCGSCPDEGLNQDARCGECDHCFLCGVRLPEEWTFYRASFADVDCGVTEYNSSLDEEVWASYESAICGPCIARLNVENLALQRKQGTISLPGDEDSCSICIIREEIGNLIRIWWDIGGSSGAIYAYPEYSRYCHHALSFRAKVNANAARRRVRIASGLRVPYSEEHVKTMLNEKQSGLCVGCQTPFSDRFPATLDHIWPVDPYAWDCEENLQLLCRTCNSAKGNNDPLAWAAPLGKEVIDSYQKARAACERLVEVEARHALACLDD